MKRSSRVSTGCCGTRERRASFPTVLPAATMTRASRSCFRRGRDAPNLARNMLIADGQWREAALNYDRAFYLFDGDTLEGARLAWKLLSGREGVERRYWAQEDGALGQEGLHLRGGAARLGAAANLHPLNFRRRSAMATEPHLFDHQARRDAPQPDRRGHQDAGGRRPSGRCIEADPHDPRAGRGLLRRPPRAARSSTTCAPS